MTIKAFIRFGVLLWAVSLITWAALRVFGPDALHVTADSAAAFSALTGVLAVAVALYEWRERRCAQDDKP